MTFEVSHWYGTRMVGWVDADLGLAACQRLYWSREYQLSYFVVRRAWMYTANKPQQNFDYVIMRLSFTSLTLSQLADEKKSSIFPIFYILVAV